MLRNCYEIGGFIAPIAIVCYNKGRYEMLKQFYKNFFYLKSNVLWNDPKYQKSLGERLIAPLRCAARPSNRGRSSPLTYLSPKVA
jgi:hypothetical protein